MKAAPMSKRPEFPLMCQGDIQNIYHLQMPRWLFTDPRYQPLALEAKVAYTFLLNRFQLSRLNGWINDRGEVFIIYTRRSLAAEMQVSYHKVLAAMKELAGAGLIWERRCGRGDANQIYLARVETARPGEESCAPFVDPGHEAAGYLPGDAGSPEEENQTDTAQMPGLRSAETELLKSEAADEGFPAPAQEVPEPDLLKYETGTSRNAESALQEVPNPDPSYTDQSHTDVSDTESSQSLYPVGAPAREDRDGGTETDVERSQLAEVLERCALWTFGRETALALEDAIERLFYSEQFRIGRAILPRASVRSRLWELDNTVLQTAVDKLRRNQREVKNTTGYTWRWCSTLSARPVRTCWWPPI